MLRCPAPTESVVLMPVQNLNRQPNVTVAKRCLTSRVRRHNELRACLRQSHSFQGTSQKLDAVGGVRTRERFRRRGSLGGFGSHTPHMVRGRRGESGVPYRMLFVCHDARYAWAFMECIRSAFMSGSLSRHIWHHRPCLLTMCTATYVRQRSHRCLLHAGTAGLTVIL